MPFKTFPIKGFAPDLPVTTPGSIMGRYVVPTDRGIGNAPKITENSSALGSQSLGGCDVYKTDYTRRAFVGIATKIYEMSTPTPTTLTDRSSGTYNASTTDTWSFGQFGDVTLAINRNDFLQASTSGSFAAVGGSPTPKASIVAVGGPPSAPVVAVFDFLDGTHTYRDGWFTSSLSDHTGWTVGTNNCAQGRLLDDSPGPIMAAIGYRDGFIAFKRSAMYRGSFVGGSVIWQWERLSADIGCFGKNCLIRADDMLYWADETAVWQFDGSFPRKVPGDVHNYWAIAAQNNVAADEKSRNFARLLWDKPKHLLWVLTNLGTDQGVDQNMVGLAWNSISSIWTHQASTPFVNAGLTLYASEVIAPRLLVTNNLKAGTISWTVDGTEPVAGRIVSWITSDRENTYTIRGFRPQWGSDDQSAVANAHGFLCPYPSQATLTPFNFGDAGTFITCAYRPPGKFDGMASSENIGWQLVPNAGVAWEILSFAQDVQGAGKQ